MPNNFDYNPGVPAAPNNPSADQPEMLINTISIDVLLAVDHVSFSTNNGGIHKQVTLRNQSAPGLGDGEGVLYANLSGGQSRPFWQDAITSYPFALITSTGTSIVQNGYITIGGLILQWGQVANPGLAGHVTFNLNPFPGGAPFSIQLTLQRASAGQIATVQNVPAPTAAGFDYITSSGGSNILYWFAIGN